MMSSTLRLYLDVVRISWHCIILLFFISVISDVATLLSWCRALSSDILRDVAAYVMAMSRHCSSALLVSTDVTAMSRH